MWRKNNKNTVFCFVKSLSLLEKIGKFDMHKWKELRILNTTTFNCEIYGK